MLHVSWSVVGVVVVVDDGGIGVVGVDLQRSSNPPGM